MFIWNKNYKFQKGQSLVEVIVASLVGILVVSALTFATIFSLRNANFAKTSAQATKLAQEGIEWVRIGRDRNSNVIISPSVETWSGLNPIWGYQISGASGCDNTATGGKCYFNVLPSGQLNNIGFGSLSLPSPAESVGQFKRAALLSDDANWQTQKIITVIVTWTDTTGPHESKLTTILRKL